MTRTIAVLPAPTCGADAMKLIVSLVAAFMLALPMPVLAETIACPSLQSAVQVGTCPGEEELRYTFRGYCSDNKRMYDQGEQLCLDYGIYRAAKNVALWESSDGRFSGYLSCDTPKGARDAAQPIEVKVAVQGSVNQMSCIYANNDKLTHRTKARCTVAATACTSAAVACEASCD